MLVNSTCTNNLDINRCCREGIFTPSFPPIGNINDKKISAEEAYQIINSEGSTIKFSNFCNYMDGTNRNRSI